MEKGRETSISQITGRGTPIVTRNQHDRKSVTTADELSKLWYTPAPQARLANIQNIPHGHLGCLLKSASTFGLWKFSSGLSFSKTAIIPTGKHEIFMSSHCLPQNERPLIPISMEDGLVLSRPLIMIVQVGTFSPSAKSGQGECQQWDAFLGRGGTGVV